MSIIAKVALTGAVAALVGGFLLGRVVADETPLPAVGDPVVVGSTTGPTRSAEPPTLRPRDDRTDDGRGRGGDDPGASPTDDDSGSGDDDSGPGSADDNSGPGNADDPGRGRGRGRGRGGDDDIPEVGPTPSTFDDHGGDDHGGDDDDDD